MELKSSNIDKDKYPWDKFFCFFLKKIKRMKEAV